VSKQAPPILKDVQFEGSSLEDLRDFPEDIKDEAGYQLDQVQRGLEPADWAPMANIGAGVNELRFRDVDGWYRVIYVAKFDKIVYVLHAFSKKTNATSKPDVELAAKRYRKLADKLRKVKKVKK
jgi:phage-related protein